MKWRKETQSYMWAHYYSEDETWRAWDKDILVKGGSRKKEYNPKTKKFEYADSYRHAWFLQNLKTGKKIDKEFKTLKAAKEYAESTNG